MQPIFSVKKYPQFDRLSKTFDTAGIDKRYSGVPIDWFSQDHGWADRNAAFMTGGKAMFVDAAQSALDDAGWTGADVDCVVTVTSTGIATPSLEAQVFTEMGFREDVMRVPVFGLGCAGGVSGLSTAQAIAAGRPGSKVLLVVVEACSLSFRADRLQKADIIATVLFGDGAAAARISSAAKTSGKIITLSQGHRRLLGKQNHDLGKHSHITPTLPATILRLWRALLSVQAFVRTSGIHALIIIRS